MVDSREYSPNSRSGIQAELTREHSAETFIFGLSYRIRFSYCVYYLLFFICFPPEVIFRSRVTGACPVATDCIAAMS